MSVLRGMTAVLAGVGRGMVEKKEDQERKARQDKEDAWRDEQRDNLRADRAKAEKLSTEVADAGMQRTTMQGTVTEAGGNKYLSADPVQATKVQEMLAAEAEMAGGPAPVQQPGAAITGNMSRGHEIKTGPLDMSAVQKLNSPEAIAERQAQAYNNNGKPLEANQMRAGAMDLQLKQLGLNEAQAKWGDMEFDRMLKQKIPMGPGFGHAFAKVLTDTNVGGLAGVKYEAVYAPDGKSFEMVGTGPDGAKHSKGKFTDDDAGWAQAMQRANSANLTTKIGYVAEALKAEQAAQKMALEERKVASTEKRNDAMAFKLMGGGGSGGGGSGGSGGGGSAGGATFDPYEGFDPKNAQAEATALVDASITEGRQPVTSAERARLISEKTFALRDAYASHNSSRQRAQVFLTEARKAQTPQQVEAVRQAALQRGFTPQEMASFDPRFAPPVAPVQAPAMPATRAPAAPMVNMSTAAAENKTVEPRGRVEFQQFQDAARLGFQPTGRGNAVFGSGEVLYVNPKTGERKYASQLFVK